MGSYLKKKCKSVALFRNVFERCFACPARYVEKIKLCRRSVEAASRHVCSGYFDVHDGRLLKTTTGKRVPNHPWLRPEISDYNEYKITDQRTGFISQHPIVVWTKVLEQTASFTLISGCVFLTRKPANHWDHQHCCFLLSYRSFFQLLFVLVFLFLFFWCLVKCMLNPLGCGLAIALASVFPVMTFSWLCVLGRWLDVWWNSSSCSHFSVNGQTECFWRFLNSLCCHDDELRHQGIKLPSLFQKKSTGSWTFVPRLCISLPILTLPSDSYCWWVACILWPRHFFTALRMFPSPSDGVLLAVTLPCLAISTPVPLFFSTFQTVDLAMHVAQATALDNFRLFFQLENGFLFFRRQLSGLHVGLNPRHKSGTDIQSY